LPKRMAVITGTR